MRRRFFLLVVCGVLSACASSGGLSSLSGGLASQDSPSPKAAVAPASAEPAQPESSGISGIWANFSSAFSPSEPPKPATAAKLGFDAPPSSINPTEALRLINEYRTARGVAPLTLDRNAAGAAEILAKDMAKHDHMSHIGPNGADIGKRLSVAGYPYRVCAENVGVGQKSLAEVVEGWKKSPPHSRNMLLAEAKHMGIAYEYKPDTKYKTFWTLVMAAP
jgi:uncharacterized protein YkwD